MPRDNCLNVLLVRRHFGLGVGHQAARTRQPNGLRACNLKIIVAGNVGKIGVLRFDRSVCGSDDPLAVVCEAGFEQPLLPAEICIEPVSAYPYRSHKHVDRSIEIAFEPEAPQRLFNDCFMLFALGLGTNKL